jgi:hypothetical protein
VRDGLATGETVVAVVSGRAAAQLRDGLGADHRDVRWQVPGLSYRSLGPMFDGWRRYLAGQYEAGNRVPLIAEGRPCCLIRRCSPGGSPAQTSHGGNEPSSRPVRPAF